jgi:hypothetical protein
MICKICNIDKNNLSKDLKCQNCSRKCIHNKRKNRCKDCDGSQICEHNIHKNYCKECNGSQICEHSKNKSICKECGGGSLCEHDKIRIRCKECNGSQYCQHKKRKDVCKECNPNAFCEHDKRKNTCIDCGGSQVCIHKIRKQHCKECYGKGLCEHNIQKHHCITCTPDSKFFCKSCRLFGGVKKKNNYLCSYCNTDKPTRQKTKELKVKTFLEENNYTFIYNKKCNLNNSCQTYYPDFLIDKGTFFLIIECDEDGHSSYPIDCEKIRENNICFALGLPCVFIRFNPDKKKIKMKIKEKVLKSYIDYYIDKEISDNEVCYLFY